jgi:hypothetical protein
MNQTEIFPKPNHGDERSIETRINRRAPHPTTTTTITTPCSFTATPEEPYSDSETDDDTTRILHPPDIILSFAISMDSDQKAITSSRKAAPHKSSPKPDDHDHPIKYRRTEPSPYNDNNNSNPTNSTTLKKAFSIAITICQKQNNNKSIFLHIDTISGKVGLFVQGRFHPFVLTPPSATAFAMLATTTIAIGHMNKPVNGIFRINSRDGLLSKALHHLDTTIDQTQDHADAITATRNMLSADTRILGHKHLEGYEAPVASRMSDHAKQISNNAHQLPPSATHEAIIATTMIQANFFKNPKNESIYRAWFQDNHIPNNLYEQSNLLSKAIEEDNLTAPLYIQQHH